MSQDNSIYFDPDGHLNEGGLSIYVDGMISKKIENVPDDVVKHVEECVDCKLKIHELYEIVLESSEINDTEEFNNDIQDLNHKNNTFSINLLLKIAASIIVIISSLLIVRFSLKSNRPAIESFGSIDTTIAIDSVNGDLAIEENLEKDTITEITQNESSAIQEPKYIAENFEPYPVYEGLIDGIYRNNNQLRILNPELNDTIPLKSTIKFKWESSINYTKLSLNILNNKGKTILNKDIQNNNSVEIINELDAGLYYWNLESTDVLFFGKFVIK